MNATDEITYLELQASDVTDFFVDDVNKLLPQLSGSAKPVTAEYLRNMLHTGTNRLFIAMHDSRIVGTVVLVHTMILVGSKDWIDDVVVDKDYRRRGISSKLMNMAEEASRRGGAKAVNLTSNPDRGGARKMYGDRGYTLRDTGVFRLTHTAPTREHTLVV